MEACPSIRFGAPLRTREIEAFEKDAELLTAEHLDLLAQIELQLRTVRHTMRHIERLRGARYRVGQELTNGEREGVLGSLSTEIDALESQLALARECCGDMHTTIEQMRKRVTALRGRLAISHDQPSSGGASGGESTTT